VQSSIQKVYTETMKNEAIYEIAYFTPKGKPGRKQVRQSRIVKEAQKLYDAGYHGIQVSYYPLIAGVNPII